MKKIKVEFKPQGITMEADREQFALATSEETVYVAFFLNGDDG